jgi:5,10-methylenetetrahydromethanopterin reductase
VRIGAMIDLSRPVDGVIAQVERFEAAGLSTAWSTQVFAYDALTLLGHVGTVVPRIELGTAVVPIYGRHPQILAQQALTVQALTGGRLVLGVGLSHRVVVEAMWGLSAERPTRYLTEYLSALVPLLAGGRSVVRGELLTALAGPLEVPDAPAPRVVVAALGPQLLAVAGRAADGTVTWMTGLATVEGHIVPTIRAAAADAGRPPPKVIVALPVVVTGEPEAARGLIDEEFSIYPDLPSYRAMLEREGARRPSDIALVGSESDVAAGLARLAAAGATDFAAVLVGGPDERRRTLEVLVASAD